MTNFKREIDLAASRECTNFAENDPAGVESDDPEVPNSFFKSKDVSSPFMHNLVAGSSLSEFCLFNDYKSKFDVYVTKTQT